MRHRRGRIGVSILSSMPQLAGPAAVTDIQFQGVPVLINGGFGAISAEGGAKRNTACLAW